MRVPVVYGVYLAKGAILIAFVIGALSVRSSFFNPHHIICTIDPHIAPEVAEEITRTVTQLVHQRQARLDITETIMNRWPVIRAVVISYANPYIAQVGVIAHIPLVCLNDHWVISSHGNLIASNQLIATRYQLLPKIIIPSSMEKAACMPESFVKAIKDSSSLLNKYLMVWRDENQILLYDMHDPHFAIMCTASGIPDTVLLDQCNALHEKLVKRDNYTERVSRVWMVDTRFTHQLIVSADQRGGVYGSSII
jgi:hypothetical protein